MKSSWKRNGSWLRKQAKFAGMLALSSALAVAEINSSPVIACGSCAGSTSGDNYGFVHSSNRVMHEEKI
jgi:hypothetical protein